MRAPGHEETLSYLRTSAATGTKTRVFCDTCFLMEPAGREFVTGELVPVLKANNRKLFLPYAVFDELERLQSNADKDKEDRSNAKKALQLIVKLQREKLIDIRRSSKKETFADQVFLEVFTKYRRNYRMILLTNDIGLGDDVLALNESSSVRGRAIEVFRFTKTGTLKQQKKKKLGAGKSDEKAPSRASPEPKEKPEPKEEPKQAFGRSRTIRQLDVEVLSGHQTPGTGSKVQDDETNTYLLGKQVGQDGGEGLVYSVVRHPTKVAKIYKPESRYGFLPGKLKMMAAWKPPSESLCWPSAPLSDVKGNFVGLLMPRAQGVPLQACLMGQHRLERHYPKWTRIELVKLALSIAEAFALLHRNNVLMGDVSYRNILADRASNAYLVDLDGAQLEGYPCPVLTEMFAAPELGRPLLNSVRSESSECFSVAIVLFMVLMVGKHPFSAVNTEGIKENIKQRYFAFSANPKEVPPGSPRYIWSYLPAAVRRCFKTAFTETHRPSASEWVDVLKAYLGELTASGADAEATAVFPKGFKPFKDAQMQSVRCTSCNASYLDNIQHLSRLQADGKEPVCPDCRELWQYRKGVAKSEVCNECGAVFPITLGEVEYRKSVAAAMPKVCPDCRMVLKQKRDAERANREAEKARQAQLYSEWTCPVCQQAFLTVGRWERLQQKGWTKPPRVCDNCKDLLYQQKNCRNCGRLFAITAGDWDTLTRKDKPFPTRCPDCRAQRATR